MNHIGSIVNEFRNMLHLTRKELSAGICSEKYLYMIEKGDRTPSTEVMRRLGDRMGVDIFKYYEYLDCAEPIQVCSFIERFYRYRLESDFNAILEDTEKASQIKDFRNVPWRYEIKINQLMLKVLCENDPIRTIPVLIDTITEIKQKEADSNSLASLYVLLSTCYQITQDIDNARRTVLLACQLVSGRQGMVKHIQVTAAVKLNKITMHFFAAEFYDVIENALDLIQYEEEMRYKGYSDQAYFYLAFAYFQSGQEEKGIQWFHKALCIMLVNRNTNNMHYFIEHEIFHVMLQDKRMSKDLIDKFADKYQLKLRKIYP